MRREDKLTSLQHENPYLYLDEEDVVVADFPEMRQTPAEEAAAEIDERIKSKVEAERRRRARLTSTTTTASIEMVEGECDWDEKEAEDEGQEPAGQQEAPSRKTKAQRKRCRHDSRFMLHLKGKGARDGGIFFQRAPSHP